MDQIIAFATLFLGLITGPQDVQVLVGAEVALVEVVLDGETIGRLEAPPWKMNWNFGRVPLPHRLVARARDASGAEIGRVEQWINVPRPPAEVQVVLDREGERVVARASWESLEAGGPESFAITLDDQPLEVADPAAVTLPPVDLDRIHLLRIDLQFAGDVEASAEVTFGGHYLDRVQSDLTAVPVIVHGRPLPVEQLGAALLAGGEAARVVGFERGPIDLVVVRDHSAVEPLREIIRREIRGMRRGNNASLATTDTQGRLKRQLPLVPGASLRFLFPFQELAAGERFRLFPHTKELGNVDGGLLWLLGQMSQPARSPAEQRLGEAVAVAAMTASRRDRRRAVILVLGSEPVDAGRLGAAPVREYLRALRVPLLVWRVASADGGRTGPSDWGEAVDISSMPGLRRATSALWAQLDEQALLWIEGRHLPGEVKLGPDPRNLALP